MLLCAILTGIYMEQGLDQPVTLEIKQNDCQSAEFIYTSETGMTYEKTYYFDGIFRTISQFPDYTTEEASVMGDSLEIERKTRWSNGIDTVSYRSWSLNNGFLIENIDGTEYTYDSLQK